MVNTMFFKNDMKEIQLTQGKFALVDDTNFEMVNQFKWFALKNRRRFYAARKVRKPDGGWTTFYLHRFLMPGVFSIDHIDGNSLNDQMSNLRPASPRQNKQGFQLKREGVTSQFRGVSWHKTGQKWRVDIRFAGKTIYLGLLSSEQDAAMAYDVAARKIFGEFASANFS